jgi:hypothetical protein
MTSSPTPSPAGCRGPIFGAPGCQRRSGAQSALADEEFALAVIDVGLPGADGLSLVRRLRSAGKEPADADPHRPLHARRQGQGARSWAPTIS